METNSAGDFPLCNCFQGHESPEAARACPMAAERLARAFHRSRHYHVGNVGNTVHYYSGLGEPEHLPCGASYGSWTNWPEEVSCKRCRAFLKNKGAEWERRAIAASEPKGE